MVFFSPRYSSLIKGFLGSSFQSPKRSRWAFSAARWNSSEDTRRDFFIGARHVSQTSILQGDSLSTGKGAWCEIIFRDGTFVKLEENSETAADTLRSSAEERTFSFSFLKGKALWMAAKIKGAAASRFSVRTPAAVCAVRGTDFSMLVSTSGQTTVGLFEGKVELSSGTARQELLAGGEASASFGDIAVQARLSRLMQAEERRYARVKDRVETLRKRLAERDSFIDDYITRQQKALSNFEARRKAKLKKH